MFNLQQIKFTLASFAILAVLAFGANQAQAHCDTLDGPVVSAARTALTESNVNLVLIWVQKQDEAEIKQAFEKTLAVRKLNAEARNFADMYFFETLVRIHRAGEGAPYSGLKPSGRDLGPAIPAADQAIKDGKLEPVAKILTEAVRGGLHQRFEKVVSRKNYAKNDVHAGREYIKAYVEYVHYVEGVYEASSGAVAEHAHDEAKPAAREHR
jgi:hypothetical protein